jgi:glycerol kinase
MYLGMDLGTSELKVVLVDDEQRLIATACHELSVQRPQPLWSEQDPAASPRATRLQCCGMDVKWIACGSEVSSRAPSRRCPGSR